MFQRLDELHCTSSGAHQARPRAALFGGDIYQRAVKWRLECAGLRRCRVDSMDTQLETGSKPLPAQRMQSHRQIGTYN